MNYRDWKVGDKVVCVAPDRKRNGRVRHPTGQIVGYATDARYPLKGETYTIRNINHIRSDKALLLLDEIQNGHLKGFIRGGLEPGFDAKFFEASS